ncbi:hypothetical protein Aph02nite_77110 [Actinoplanes philippinensis]|uniref:hypothetical protein n=1 Tax=Actinoplanes philippinensis TaxID=35752 RepID=UPI000B847E55|nr:hypothetical protein [Actinoplanes philippinensis]GIE81761.1 hypothetical protein Aph02nite_77110 [Actinoplanes philippinensis]
MQRTGAVRRDQPANSALLAYAGTWSRTSQGWRTRNRSAPLRRIDDALAGWAAEYQASQAPIPTMQGLRHVEQAVVEWSLSKGDRVARSARAPHIRALAQRLAAALTETGAEVADQERQRQRSAAATELFQRIDPRLQGIAHRRGPTVNPDAPVHRAFLADRDDEGRLSPASVATIENRNGQTLAERLDTLGHAGIERDPSMTDTEVRDLAGSYANPVTGTSEYPEVASYLADGVPTARWNTVSVRTMDVPGAPIFVIGDTADQHYAPRYELLREAVGRVRAAGFEIPELTVRLPRYSRKLILAPDRITVGEKIFRNEYVHGTLLLSAHAYGTPLPAYLSTQLDREVNAVRPEHELKTFGVASMVHELGHFLHHRQSPGLFADLQLAAYEPAARRTAETVSHYAQENPREFVAEVFMMRCFGRPLTDEVAALYRRLGGPEPRR